MASSIKKKLQLNGLWTYRDKYSQEPEGAMLEADNVNLDKLNIASPRVGFESAKPDNTLLTTGTMANMFNYGNKVAVSAANLPMISDSVVDYSGLPSLSALTSPTLNSGAIKLAAPPTGMAYHSFAAAADNIYMTTKVGVLRKGSGDTYAVAAGMPRAPWITAAVDLVAATMPWTNTQMAYRAVFYKEDASGRRYVGPPTERVWFGYDGGGANFAVTVTVGIPAGSRTGWFVQFYRTKVQPYTTGDDDLAGDDMFLVYEAAAPSGTSATFLAFSDIVADSYMGGALYTNTSQEGIQQANTMPPLAKHLEPYSDYMFYGNVTTPASTTLTLTKQLVDGVGTSTGSIKITLISPIGLGAVTTYYARTAPVPDPSTQFGIGTNPVLAIALQETMDNLATLLNNGSGVLQVTREQEGANAQLRFSIASQWAYAYSGIQIESIDNSTADSFSPTIRTTAPLVAAQTESPNRVMYSKADEPEAVPTMNYLTVGDPSEQIIGLNAMRDKLIITKERSVWKVVGSDPQSFSVQLLDATTSIVDGRTVKSLSNKLYALSLQGIVAISESVQIISRRITDLLVDKSATEAAAWVDEEHGLYILNPGLHTAGENKLIVYSYLNDNFTTWSFTEDEDDVYYTPHMGITINSRMLMGVKKTVDKSAYASSVPVFLCQRGLWNSDAAYGDCTLYVKYSAGDLPGPLTMIAPTGSIGGVVMTNGISYLQVGAKLYQCSSTGVANTGVLQVLSVEFSGATAIITVDVLTTPTGTTDVHYSFAQPTKAVMTWWPFIGEGIDTYKEFKELAIVSEVPVSGAITASFTTDLEPNESTYSISSSDQSLGWGEFPWGQAPWGGTEVPRNKVERLLIPATTSKAHELNTTVEVFSNRQKWEISGISLNYRNIGFTSNNRGDK